MIKRWIDTVTALAPFLEAYPSWVKVLICAWVLFSAIILAIIFLALLFTRKSPDTKRTELGVAKPTALTQAISGLGGVGKTQLATEYAYRHMADYSLVWWVGAEEPAKLASDYAQLAGKLPLPEEEKEATDQRVVVDAVRRWLERNTGWLLIFDNAAGPEEVRPYLPRGGGGHVLVTSRNPNWGSLTSSLSVKPLEPGESVEFLLKRTGRKDQEADEAAAALLADALGHLPLALEQAGAYIEQTRTSLSEYLELFGEQQRELLGRGNPPAGYEATVATTWEISFQQVSNVSPGAVDLLNLCAFLAPDEIPKKLLRGGSEHLPESLAATVEDTLAFDDAVAARPGGPFSSPVGPGCRTQPARGGCQRNLGRGSGPPGKWCLPL